MEQTDSWAASVAKEVGQRVAYYRTRSLDEHGRKLTTQALADRTAELGYPMDRSVLAKFEKGYRLTVTVPDVLVIAAALRISPLQLLLPLGQSDQVEILPGVEVETTAALGWLAGERPLPGSTWAEDRPSIVANFQTHQQLIDRWTAARHAIQVIKNGPMPEGSELDIQRHETTAFRAEQALENVRALIRTRGLTPPPVPDGMLLIMETHHAEAIRRGGNLEFEEG